MSSIYTARSIAPNEKSTPLFQLKGLKNFAPTTVTNLLIHGIPLERQIAYTQYSSNIASFLSATDRRQTLTITPRPLGPLTRSPSLPLRSPTVSFTLIKPLTSDRSDKFITKLGPGASRTQSGRITIYHAPALPYDVLSSICLLSTPFFNAGRDAVNPKGMQAYTFLNSIICTFLSVHSYPAFIAENSGSQVVFEQLVGGNLGGQYTARDRTTKAKDSTESRSALDLTDKCYSVILNRMGVEDDTMEDDLPERAQTSVGYLSFKGDETVARASPITHRSTSIGSTTSVPKSTGNVFPYFDGLIQPDGAFMNSMVLRHFYQLLGKTVEECQDKYLDMRHGVNSLATTSHGMVLCHILLGIDLALSTQSRCYVIIEKYKYQGFCLLGARYAIFSNSRWFAADDEETFLEQLTRIDPHESAIDDMLEVMRRLTTNEQYTGSLSRMIFADPQALTSELSLLKLDDIEDDDIRELDRCVRNLNYMGTGYLTKNPQMVLEMLTTITSNASISLTTPTYLPSIKAPFSSDYFKLLSRFGPDAPSFWNDRGTEISCKALERSVASTGGKRKVGEMDVYGNMPSKLMITPKPLLIAVKDFEKVVEKGKVKMDVGERAGRYRHMTVEHEDTRKAIWKELVSICSDTMKKRKVVESDDKASGVDIDALMANLLD